jgi:hypothetical protein
MGLLYHLEKARVKHGAGFVVIIVDGFAPGRQWPPTSRPLRHCTLTSYLFLLATKSTHTHFYGTVVP